MLDDVTLVALVLAFAAFAYAFVLRIAEWWRLKGGDADALDADRLRERLVALFIAVVLLLIAATAAALHDKVGPPGERPTVPRGK